MPYTKTERWHKAQERKSRWAREVGHRPPEKAVILASAKRRLKSMGVPEHSSVWSALFEKYVQFFRKKRVRIELDE